VVASYFAQPDPIGSFQDFGNHELSGFGTALIAFTLICFVIGLTPLAYGAVLDSITAIDSIKRIRPNANWRIGAAIGVFIVSSIIACAVPDNLVADYNTLVTLILYFLIPWTAINLVDYYFVRRGKYVISELFKVDGIYGQWNWRGLTAYAVGAVSMIPFYNLSFYEGPATKSLGGADISFLVGIVVSAVVYYVLAHGTVTAESALVHDEQRTHPSMVSSFEAPETGSLATE
jgi:nucleobase:cation symporter-1, NCS1 family